MHAYRAAGEQRAYALNNRGPVRYTEAGTIHPHILAAYWKYGFYVFENVLNDEELADIETDVKDILARLPIHKGSPVDAQGRPALGHHCQAPTLF